MVLGAVINETFLPLEHHRGVGKWTAYNIEFRAAKFEAARRIEPARVSVYLNGVLVPQTQVVNQVRGGPNSGLDVGNDKGRGIADTPGPIKLQAEGHDVCSRDIWILPVA